MKIELGSTYVTAEGNWVKIVGKSCSRDEPHPYRADSGTCYTENGECGVGNWNLKLQVPEEQVALRKIEDLLKELSSADLSVKRLGELQKQAQYILNDGKLATFVQHTYR
jgi:hypothetical protein